MSDLRFDHVVVGAGVAGGRAVEALSRRSDSVALIGAERWRPYSRPPLSKDVLTGSTPVDSLFLRGDDWYRNRGVGLRLDDRVVALDPDEPTVVLASGRRVGFGRLLLAPGVEPVRLALHGADRPGIHYLRTIDDALAVRRALQRGRRVVVVGGGFIGCEIAASLSVLGARVDLVETEDRLLSRVLGAEVGGFLTERHRAAGVQLHLGARLEAFLGVSRLEAVRLGDGREIECDLAVVGVGARPRVAWLAGSGVQVRDGVVVDASCRTTREHVFAAGDAADSFSPRLGRRRRVEHEANAQSQAVVAARNMLGGEFVHDPVDYSWSQQYDLDMWMLGETTPDCEVDLGFHGGRSTVLATYHHDGRTVGAAGINRPAELAAARRLLQDRRTFSPGDVNPVGLTTTG